MNEMSPLVIGVGNRFRGDDALGPIVTDLLRNDGRVHARTIEVSGEGAGLINLLRESRCVIIIDAVQSGAKTGTLHRFDLKRERLPIGFMHYSSHAFGVAEAVSLARELNSLPQSLYFLGIEGANFAMGHELSNEVSKAMPNLMLALKAFIKKG